MPIIKSPVPDYTGQTGSVVFVNGEGFTEDANHIEWFKEHGYEVVEDKPVNTTSKADKEPKDKNPEDTNPENKDPEDKEPKDEGPKDKNPEDKTSGKGSGKK